MAEGVTPLKRMSSPLTTGACPCRKNPKRTPLAVMLRMTTPGSPTVARELQLVAIMFRIVKFADSRVYPPLAKYTTDCLMLLKVQFSTTVSRVPVRSSAEPHIASSKVQFAMRAFAVRVKYRLCIYEQYHAQSRPPHCWASHSSVLQPG